MKIITKIKDSFQSLISDKVSVKIIEGINEYRKNNYIKPFIVNPHLNKLAKAGAKSFAYNKYLKMDERSINLDIWFWAGSECYGFGQSSVVEIIQTIHTYKPYKEMILSNYQYIGCGKYGKYWVVCLADCVHG